MPIFSKNETEILFIHIPKCAGTSVEKKLKSVYQHFNLHSCTMSELPCTPQHFHASLLPIAVKKLKIEGLDVKGITLDQSNENSVNNSIKIIKEEYRAPDILINAGCSRPMTRFFNDTVENWDKSMEVNARGMFITCREFGNEMAING